MTVKRLCCCLAFMLMMAALCRSAEEPLAQWPYAADIVVENEPTVGVIEVIIPPEFYAKSLSSDFADLRLATADGKIVPYALIMPQRLGGERPVKLAAQLLNPLFVPNKQSSIVADFGSKRRKNAIEVEMSGDNFRRQAMVEASDDASNWQVLRKGAWLFCFAQKSLSWRQIDLPANDMRYLRVTVFHGDGDTEAITISAVRAWTSEEIKPDVAEIDIVSRTVWDDLKKVTIIALDLGIENLPLWEINFDFADANFLRFAEVGVRNQLTRTILEPRENAPPLRREVAEEWAQAASGTLYRFSTGGEKEEGMRLALGGHRARYLQVIVHNGDDPPLHLQGVRVWYLRHRLIFPPQGAGKYKLYVGKYADAPSYDFRHFAERMRQEGVVEAKVGPLHNNDRYQAPPEPPPQADNSVFLWLALLVVLGVLAGVVIKQMRHISLDDDKNESPKP